MCGAELHTLPEGVQRVAQALQNANHPHTPVMLDGAARTAQEAADGLGVQLGQIAKSVIFKRKEDGVAVLVVASGDRRVDEKKVSALVGKIGRADADFVKAQTGFTIGGVSPVAHLNAPVTLLDQDQNLTHVCSSLCSRCLDELLRGQEVGELDAAVPLVGDDRAGRLRRTRREVGNRGPRR